MTKRRQVALSRQNEVEALEALGLTPISATVLIDVIAHPSTSHAEIGQRNALDVNDVQEALNFLQGESLIVRSAGDFAVYQAVSPQTGLSDRVSEAEAAITAAHSVVRDLDRVFHRAVRSAHPASKVEVITGAVNIVARIRSLEENARSQVRVFDTPPHASRLEDYNDVIDNTMLRGVTHRAIYDRESLAIPGRLEGDIGHSLSAGELSRVVDKLPLKLLIVDDSAAIVPQTARADNSDSAYLIHPCAVLDGLIALFETTWHLAYPLVKNRPTGQKPLGTALPDTAVLNLLMAGHTDDGIARSLGISPRTAQRRVKTLMVDLRADNRFQAGIAAVLQGWVDLP